MSRGRTGWGRLQDSQFLRFLAIGLLNTLFGYGLFSLLVLSGTAPGVALFVATVVGVLFNYFTTGQLVFAARGIGRLPWFVGVYGLTFLVNLWSLKGLIGTGLPPLAAQAVLLPAITFLTFALNKLFVFRGAP